MKKLIFLSLILSFITQGFCAEQATQVQTTPATTEADVAPTATVQELFSTILQNQNLTLSDIDSTTQQTAQQDELTAEQEQTLLNGLLGIYNQEDATMDEASDQSTTITENPMDFEIDPSIFDSLPPMDWKTKVLFKIMFTVPKVTKAAKATFSFIFSFIKANPLLSANLIATAILFLAATAWLLVPVLGLPIAAIASIITLIFACIFIPLSIAADAIHSLIWQYIPLLKTLQAKYGIFKPNTAVGHILIKRIFSTINTIINKIAIKKIYSPMTANIPVNIPGN